MSTNDITGDRMVSRANTEAFENNYDAIFRKKQKAKYSVQRGEVPYLTIGGHAILHIVEHPNLHHFDGPVQQTSEVISYDKDTGVIETANTIYEPVYLD